jgi:hypothetical protein
LALKNALESIGICGPKHAFLAVEFKNWGLHEGEYKKSEKKVGAAAMQSEGERQEMQL